MKCPCCGAELVLVPTYQDPLDAAEVTTVEAEGTNGDGGA